MRKLFALLVVLALVAGASFAQLSIGGGVDTKIILAGVGYDGEEEIKADLTATPPVIGVGPKDATDTIKGGFGAGGKINFSAENDDSTFGGFLRLSNGVAGAYAWWKPIDMFKMTIGNIPDGGIWGRDSTFGWGFMQGANDSVTTENYGFNKTFAPGVDSGLFLEIKPIDLLGININLPYAPGKTVEDIFKGVYAQVAVSLDIADFLVTYKGTDDLYIGAYLGGLIPNIGIDVGAHINFGDDPIYIGLGVDAALSDAFGIKVRLQAEIDDDFGLGFHVLPYFAVSDSFKVALNAGMDMKGDAIKYHINPYIEINGGGPAFYAGFILQGTTVEDKVNYNGKMKWSIPIGISFGF